MAILLRDDFNNLNNLTLFQLNGTITNPASVVRGTITAAGAWDVTGWQHNTGILAQVGDLMRMRCRANSTGTFGMFGITTNPLSIGFDAANAYFVGSNTQLFINGNPANHNPLAFVAAQWYDFLWEITGPGLIEMSRKLDSEPDTAYVVQGNLLSQGSFVGFDGNTVFFQGNFNTLVSHSFDCDFIEYERPGETAMPLGIRSKILRERPGLKPNLKIGGKK